MGYGSPYESDFEHNHGWENPSHSHDFDTDDHSDYSGSEYNKKTIAIVVICIIKVILITLGVIYLCKRFCRCCKRKVAEKEEGILFFSC